MQCRPPFYLAVHHLRRRRNDGYPGIDQLTVNKDPTFLAEATLSLDFNADGDTTDTLTSDQRGYAPRSMGGSVDIGAVEVGAIGSEMIYLPLVQR